jgi:hypothetical protein
MFVMLAPIALQSIATQLRDGTGGRKGTKMKILAAVLGLVLLANPVHAQNMGGMGGGGKGGGKGQNSSQNTEKQKADQQKKKAAEDSYKAGLQSIPDAKEKYDPWRSAR